MADYAAPLFHIVAYWRMRLKRFGDARSALQRFLGDGEVAGRTAIYDVEIRQPDLLNPASEVAFHCRAIRAGREKGTVPPLIVAPFFKKVLGGRDRQGDQEQNTGPRKAMGRGCEKRPV